MGPRESTKGALVYDWSDTTCAGRQESVDGRLGSPHMYSLISDSYREVQASKKWVR